MSHLETDNKLKVTVLGCGGSMGVPHIGNYWGECDPKNPKNRRTRNALFIEKGETKILVDCGPDVHQQLNTLGSRAMMIDAALVTHIHPDHSVGLFELGIFKRRSKEPFPVYADSLCGQDLTTAYPFLFLDKPYYPKQIDLKLIEDGERFVVGDVTIDAFAMDHGVCTTFAYIFDEKVAYCTDTIEIPSMWLDRMQDMNLDTFITECTDFKPMPNHAHYDLALSWAQHVRAKRTYLTDLRAHIDYNELLKICPESIEPAYDGLEIICD